MITQQLAPSRHEILNLPVYQCHKRVRAAKILAIYPQEDDAACLCVDVKAFASVSDETANIGHPLEINVDAAWMAHNSKVAIGGYFVQYIENADLYTAYSPAEPFESGYALL